jgi:hypothetical protein
VSEMAENGQVAVNIVLKEVDKFDIIFMDNQMPVLVRNNIHCFDFYLRATFILLQYRAALKLQCSFVLVDTSI